MVSGKSKQYDLPRGGVGREFVRVLTDEVNQRKIGSTGSIYGSHSPMDHMVKKAGDIMRLIKKRIEQWKGNMMDELISEFDGDARGLMKGQRVKSRRADDHKINVFTRLVLRGQIRSAVRWLTERGSERGVLPYSGIVESTGKTVSDVLKSKHPEPSSIGAEAFMECEELPSFVHVDRGAHR